MNTRKKQSCCDEKALCNKDTLLNHSEKITYYSDEKLEQLTGIPKHKLSKTQIALLSEVFYSLNEEDIAGWLRSLQLRRIELTTDLREQALLIISERRKYNSQNI